MSKHKFQFNIQPQGLSVKCNGGFVADAEKLPSLYLSVQKGSHSARTTSVQLTSSKYKTGCFSASWKSNDAIEMTLPLTRRTDIKGYEAKEIKVAVKFDDLVSGKQHSLASCKFDVSSLNLDKKKSERKVLELIPSRRASQSADEAFKSVSVVMTIAYKPVDGSAAALDSGSERSGSISPPSYLTESFLQGVKVGATGTGSPSRGSVQNGELQHQTKQQPSKQKQQQEQLTSKQQVPTSKQEHSTSKQQQQICKLQEPKTKLQLMTAITTDKQPEGSSNMQQQTSRHHHVDSKQQQANGNQSEHASGDVGPTLVSTVEPVDDQHGDTLDGWQSDKTAKSGDAEISPAHTNYTANTIISNEQMSPVSSESVALSDVELQNDDSFIETNQDGVVSQLTPNKGLVTSPLREPSQLSPRKRALSVDVLSPTASDKTPIFFEQNQPLQSRQRSQTVLGEPRKKAPPIPTGKSPNAVAKKPLTAHSSLGNLRRPVQSSVASVSGLSSGGVSYYGKFDVLGILRVRLRGVSIPDLTGDLMEVPAAPPPRGRSVSVGTKALPEATHGIYCNFTINGGNTSAKSETCKILPFRPVLWEDTEKEKLFFTNHSRQLFVLCRKVPLKKKSKSKASSEVCVGASVMKIIEVGPTLPEKALTDYASNDGLQWYNMSLPLQPKGEVELSVSFEGLTPRFKVTCEGIVTVMKVSGIDCPWDVDLSCTVKLDSNMLDSTNVYTVEECVTDGWYDEPIGFKARRSLDLVVQIWAYSDDGSAKWCGLSMLPLATALHEHDVHKTWASTPTGGKEREVFVYSKNERTITCPVEPQGTIELKVVVSPVEKIKSQEFVPIEVSTSVTPVSSAGLTNADKEQDDLPAPTELLQPDSVDSEPTLKRQGTLRRKFLNRNKQKDMLPETQGRSADELRQENTDLKREVEYLREQLRIVKAKLADSEFHKEKAEAELRTIKHKEDKSLRTRIFSFGRK